MLLGLVVGMVMLRTTCLGETVMKCFLCGHVLLQVQQGLVGACNILAIVDGVMLPFDRHHLEIDVFEVLLGEGWCAICSQE